MKISERTISALSKCITGDGKISPYNSGPNLIKFFNELGFNDAYGQGFPSRWMYTEERIRQLNDTPKLAKVFHSLLDPRAFLETTFKVEDCIKYLNQYLKYDGYEVVKVGNAYRIKEIRGTFVEIEPPFKNSGEVNHVFIEQQIKKCDKKILEDDFDGAITNARSLLEAILREVECKLGQNPPPYDGDLVKLYKRVQKLLHLEPARKDITDTIKQMLGGLFSVVSGLSGLRNKMSDSHVQAYKPDKHHAKLAVNTAKTLADFIFDMYTIVKQNNT